MIAIIITNIIIIITIIISIVVINIVVIIIIDIVIVIIVIIIIITTFITIIITTWLTMVRLLWAMWTVIGLEEKRTRVLSRVSACRSSLFLSCWWRCLEVQMEFKTGLITVPHVKYGFQIKNIQGTTY